MTSPEPRTGKAWEYWWDTLDGTPGEVVWAADAGDLAADLVHFAAAFGDKRPVVDLGCGDGRQTRYLSDHFATVRGVDFSPAAISRARSVPNPPGVSFSVLNAGDPAAAVALHNELGDVNVYVRGVLQALPSIDRPRAVESITALLGEGGALFVKELSPQATAYFTAVTERYGVSQAMARVMELIPPGEVSESDLAGLFPADWFTVVSTGTSRISTVNMLPNGAPFSVPAVYALIRPRR